MGAAAKLLFLIAGLLPALLFPGCAHAVAIFSEGMLTPETISQAPAGFGDYAGAYLVPDAARSLGDPSLHNVWIVPANGGSPAVFSTGNPDVLLGGLFLPQNWGVNAGRFLTIGRDTLGGTLGGVAYAYAPQGTRTLIGEYPEAPFNQALIAPQGFGSLGGQLIATEVENGGRVNVISPDGVLTHFADSALMTQAFGLAFAPAGFGSVGGQLLVSDPFAGTVVAIDSDGRPASFAAIPLLDGQTGLRQMAFAPADFLLDLGIPGDLLMVSIAGSLFGGGTLGDVVALDAGGAIVASLRVAEALEKFDPRGMLFRSDGSLLISDASDPVVIVTADDFRVGRFANAPEPSLPLLLAIGIAGLLVVREARAFIGQSRRATPRSSPGQGAAPRRAR